MSRKLGDEDGDDDDDDVVAKYSSLLNIRNIFRSCICCDRTKYLPLSATRSGANNVFGSVCLSVCL